MNILVKFPTRGRPAIFLSMLQMYVDSCEDKSRVFYLVTIDENDDTMTEVEVKMAEKIAGKGNIRVVRGTSANKIDACNRDLNEFEGDWDIVLLASDDMKPQVMGWDQIVRDQMTKHYPDTDGCLWFYDGHQNRICTMSIMGRKRYERFKYLYHPSYVSLWCDNEWTDVNNPVFIPVCLFRHVHPMWEGKRHEMDALYLMNERFFKRDQSNYKARKRAGFPS